MTTHIAHLNCATMRPVGSFGGRGLPPEGLLLVDTGFGTADLADPRRLGRPFVTMVRPSFDPAETARAQVEARGFTCNDVTDIALTHLDLDHAGGLADFPNARVHVFADELDAARHPKVSERQRYVSAQWAHHPQWVEHRPSGEEWFGFTAVQALGDDVVLVPLTGHTRGHCGVAVRRPEGGWMLHAGDSYFYAGETLTPPTFQRGLSVFQTMMAANNRQRRANQERLRTLRAEHGDEVLVFSAHDRSEYDALAGAAERR